jgi:hypothetical protein
VQKIYAVIRERSCQCVDIGGTATDRCQHHDDPILGVERRVVNVRTFGTAAIVV